MRQVSVRSLFVALAVVLTGGAGVNASGPVSSSSCFGTGSTINWCQPGATTKPVTSTTSVSTTTPTKPTTNSAPVSTMSWYGIGCRFGWGNYSPVTVTEQTTSATLTGTGTEPAATGHAVYRIITCTTSTSTTTNSCLIICVKGLTLADNSVVTFQLNGSTIGTGTVTSGRAHLHLSTKKGDVVPTVAANDSVTVLDAGSATILSGTFGAVTTQTDTCRRWD